MKKTIVILFTIILFISCQEKKNDSSKNDTLTNKIEQKEKEIKLKELELKDKELSNSINKLKEEISKDKSELKEQKTTINKNDKIILNIRNVFNSINNNIKEYEVQNIHLNESTEGGILLAYLEKEKLKKIEIKNYGEMGKWFFDYYFSDEKLVFAFSQNFKYNKPMYMKGSKISEIKENRYYFHEYKLCKWLDSNNEDVSKSIFEEKGNELNRNVFELKRKIQLN